MKKSKKSKKTIRERYNEWSYQHIVLKYIIEYGWTFLVCTLSAFLFAFGFKSFMVPDALIAETAGSANPIQRLVSGGVSGIAQNITLILELIFGKGNINENLSYSILYFGINIPIFFLAFFGIGKRFAVFTLINVIEVSLFTSLLSSTSITWLYDFIETVSRFMEDNGALLSRALFAGVCTGLSSALAFKVDISAGGVDVIAYYVSLKKGTSTGKYTVLLNAVTVIVFAILNAVQLGWADHVGASFGALLFSFLYMLSVMMIVDLIHVRNKKCEVKVVTSLKDMSDYLLANIPHGATLVKGQGAFSGEEKTIIWMVISTFEVDNLVKIVQEEDQHAFIQVTPLNQVYGRFFIKPVR